VGTVRRSPPGGQGRRSLDTIRDLLPWLPATAGVTLADVERGNDDRRIVVGVDGSEASLRALDWAAREAISWTAGLDVVHTWTEPYSNFAEGAYVDPAHFESDGRRILDGAVAWLGRHDAVPADVRPRLVADDAAAGLVRAARDARLLVVGSRGHGGFAGLLLGSVSRWCVDHATCPVAVIPPKASRESQRRIVVGVDGSEPSYEALRWAFAEAARHDARLDVVNAYDEHRSISPFGPIGITHHADLEAASRALLEKMTAGAPGRVGVELLPCPTGAARALLETADGAALLVVGSRGRGTAREVLLGSVSHQCVHHTPCPIVVVRPPRAPEPEPETQTRQT
jgi:nucleotide-binding universal stress UspA family protein